MRRTTTVALVATLLLVLLAAAVALADTITCAPGSTSDNPCWGTNGDDTLTGTTSDDVVYGAPGEASDANEDVFSVTDGAVPRAVVHHAIARCAGQSAVAARAPAS